MHSSTTSSRGSHSRRGVITAALVIGAAALGLVASMAVAVSPSAPEATAATQICEKYGSMKIQGDRYVVQNNEWGDSAGQCISVTDTGFSIVSGEHNVPTNGEPAGYPSIYAGCHYGNCSTNSGLPLQISSFGDVTSTVSYTTASGYWNASYDLWFDPNPTILHVSSQHRSQVGQSHSILLSPRRGWVRARI